MESGFFASLRLASAMDRRNQAEFPEEVGFGLSLEEQVKLEQLRA